MPWPHVLCNAGSLLPCLSCRGRPRLLPFPVPACYSLAPDPHAPRTPALVLGPPTLWVTSGSSFPVSGMSHEPKSPSLGMLSTATRTTATVNPLTPSPLNGALVPSGSPATSSALSAQAAPSSSFAAALRKLAKQAEEPRGKRRAPQAAARGGRAQPPCSRPGLLGEAGARPRNSGFPRAGAGAAAALTGLWRLRARTCSGHSCLSLAASFWGGSAVPTAGRPGPPPGRRAHPTLAPLLCFCPSAASVCLWLWEPLRRGWGGHGL